MLRHSISDIMVTATIALARLTRFALDQPAPDDLDAIVATLHDYKDQVAESGVTARNAEIARLAASLNILGHSCEDAICLLLVKNLAQNAAAERDASALSGRIELIREMLRITVEILRLLPAEHAKS